MNMRDQMPSGESGMSLLEILMALMILALVMAGMGSVLAVSRMYTQHNRSRVAAVQMMKYLNSPLNDGVNAANFDQPGGMLKDGNRAGESLYLDGISYTSTYNITNVPVSGTGQVRKVTATVYWNDTK